MRRTTAMALSGFPADPQPNTQDPHANLGTDGHEREAGADPVFAQEGKAPPPRRGRNERGTHPSAGAAPTGNGLASSGALSEDEQVAVMRALRKEVAGRC